LTKSVGFAAAGAMAAERATAPGREANATPASSVRSSGDQQFSANPHRNRSRPAL